MIKLLVAVVALCFISSARGESPIRFEALGEPGNGGAMTSLRVSPHDRQRMLSGGDMLGAAFTTDGGKTWQRSFGFDGYEMADVTWHPRDPMKVWIASCSGPYLSEDGGLTFTSRRAGMPEMRSDRYSAMIQKILFDPADETRLFAFGGSARGWGAGSDTFGWVWESTDGGQSWTHLTTLAQTGVVEMQSRGGGISAATFTAGDSPRLVVVSGGGVLLSDDRGRTWRRGNRGLPADSVFRLIAHPTDRNVIWLCIPRSKQTPEADCEPGGVYKSTDGGESWVSISKGLAQKSNPNDNFASTYYALAVSMSRPDTMYTVDGSWGTGVVYSSTDGGRQWKPLATRTNVENGTASASRDSALAPLIKGHDEAFCLPAGMTFAGIEVDPVDDRVVYAFGTEYIGKSVDGGHTWTDSTSYRPDPSRPDRWRGRGWTGWCSTNIVFNPHKRGMAIIQGMDAAKAWISDDDLKSWRYAAHKDANPWVGGTEAVFTKDGRVYVLTGQHGGFNGVMRSDDNGTTWKTFIGAAHGLPEFSWGGSKETRGMHVDPTNSDRLWITIDRQLHASIDGGKSWKAMASPQGAAWLAGDPTNPDRFYVSAADGVYVSDDNGKTFRNIGGPKNAHRGRVNTDSLGRVYVCQYRDGPTGSSGGVFRYSPATSAWEKLLDEPFAMECAADPGDPNRLAVVTNIDPYNDLSSGSGVWISSDAGKTWNNEVQGLWMKRGQAIAFDPHTPGRLVVGTFGAGFGIADWPLSYKPVGSRSYAMTPADAEALKAPEARAQAAHVIRAFGRAGFDYTYDNTSWNGETVKQVDDAVEISATEHGGAGIVVGGVSIRPEGQTHLALSAKVLPGNEAASLRINVLDDGKSFVVDLSKLNADNYTTVLIPLGEGEFASVKQIQIQGENFSPTAKPLKIRIQSLSTVVEPKG